MTYSDFVAALGVRDFHMKRIWRFINHRSLKWETSADLVRSLRLADACTSFLGDGLYAELPPQLTMLVRAAGYRREV